MRIHNKLMNLIKVNQKATKRFEVIRNENSPTELYIYDVIDSWFGVSAEEFVKQLNSIDESEIIIRINSPGGDSFDGVAIAAAITSHKSVITAKIDGLCASAATTIANACDHIEMASESFYMIHNNWTIGMGDNRDLTKTAKLLKDMDLTSAKALSKRTGLSVDEVSQMMNDETWLNAEDAKAKGFVNDVLEQKAVNNTFNLSVYDNAPQIEHKTPEPKPMNKEFRKRIAQIKINELSS